MIIRTRVRIKHNGKRYYPGDKFQIEEKDFESINDIVEVIDDSPKDLQEEFDTGENDLTVDDLSEDKELNNEIDYDDLTKPEIVEILKERSIEHNPRDKKENLVGLLERSEQDD